MRSLALALVLFLAGCATTNYPLPQPATTSRGSVTLTRVNVEWHDDPAEIYEKCPLPGRIVYACAVPFIDPQKPSESYCTIYAMKPTSFEDVTRLALLGHEFWHCLGAQHLLSAVKLLTFG